jgi:beta-glucosidase
VKHFAAYGGAEAGRDYNAVDLSEHTLREFYLPAYKACIDAGVKMLMPSFNTLNGVPATANSWLMKKILKEEWNADVLVISDWGAIGMLKEHGTAATKKEASKLAFECGCHIDMCGGSYMKYLKELVEEGAISEAQIDEAVLKVLQLKADLGLFEDPYHGASKEREDEVILIPEHRALARKAGAECAVLLKNEGVLPVSKQTKKIALIGPFSDTNQLKGAWAGKGVDDDTISVREGMLEKYPDAEFVIAKGCEGTFDETDKSGFAEAISAAKEADVVILCLGEAQNYSGEATSRTDLTLPGLQDELAEEVIKANSNTAVILFTGRPLVLKRLDAIAPAILNMWFPGTEAGNAVADLVSGDVNPCGKISMSFPKAVGQCPLYYNHMNTGRPKSIEDDDMYKPFHSNYMDCGNLPLYSFGHGLSYSNFAYQDLELSKDSMNAEEKVTVKITISNESDVAGKETGLLFMRDKVASNARPVQQLIAFEKILLQPKERKTVKFTVNESMLRFWNNENKFVSESGDFTLSTGYADNLIFTQKFKLK